MMDAPAVEDVQPERSVRARVRGRRVRMRERVVVGCILSD